MIIFAKHLLTCFLALKIQSMLPYEYIRIEKMTPEEQHPDCSGLSIQYHFHKTIFGKMLIASTDKGICYMGFSDDECGIIQEMRQLYPKALLSEEKTVTQEKALAIFLKKDNASEVIKLHLKGTDFQLKVWNALLHIPIGELATYSQIAGQIGKAKACRAVGSAVGANPVSLLIPCHRVVRASGEWGNYHWGADRKAAIIRWEMEQTHPMTN